ncbi:unnamed protein product [Tenebrio molitor]|nr:unnamed protein product [Tenebrio molitor]
MSVEEDASRIVPEAEARKTSTHLSPDYEIKHREEITIVKQNNDELEKFVEREEFLLTKFEYPRNGKDPGLVLIFNQECFEDKKYRLGSRRDVNELITCMSRIGFNIHENHIFTDYTRDKILNLINKIAQEDLSQINSLIVFFLTHGDEFNRLHAYDVSVDTHELWEVFDKCEDLKNKPKMFVFQACKGDNYSTISKHTNKTIQLVPDSTFNTNHIGPDMLIVYSTTEGNVSFRDPKTGTWFIQELCKNFSAYGRRDDVISLITRTTKCLCRNYYHNDQDAIKKQMPVFVSTLKKKFYLNRSKERNVLIKLIENQEAMQESIDELEKKVNELLQDKEKRNK